MATFYLLPPRACLEEMLSEVLSRMLPGLPVPAEGWDLLLLHLAAHSGWSKDLYLLSRDDLPEGEPLEQTLRQHYGAEAGDRVVEVPLARVSVNGPTPVRTWTLPTVAVSTPSVASYNHSIPEPPVFAVTEFA